MKSRVAAYLLMAYFLMGSTLLPLGDFSLIQQLPRMYAAYQKVASPEEADIMDFIGDYLLNGRQLLGHNKADRPEKQGSAIQFQNAGYFAAVVEVAQHWPLIIEQEHFADHVAVYLHGKTSDFYSELFRPPLA